MSANYPPAPSNVDPSILEPSKAFKSEATKAMAAILFFILVYFLLVAAGFGLAALCAAGGIGLIVLKPMFVTLMLGVGLAGLGVMVLFFLFKFLFKKHTIDRSGLMEVKEEDQPQLFEFIRQLTKETQTPFPKKIYLSADVNASVFYNSSFWSMFLPVKKNLQIGLGLVNVINLSEFKAILAHEFGHFSQRSMKLGSYVYNVNQIIFNLLYDNDGFERTVSRWGDASGYFAFFAALTVRIVAGIQWILQQVYKIVNKQYLSLSRQMEFHADTVAASVSGGNHLITSLRRLEIANEAYESVFNFYQRANASNLKPENVYPQQITTLLTFADRHRLPVTHGLPQVDASAFARFNQSRITVKDQWASHPSTDDREKHLRSLNLETPTVHDSAWTIFNRPEQIQKEFTDKIYNTVQYQSTPQVLDAAAFRERFSEEYAKYELNKIYRGFFDSRDFKIGDLRRLETKYNFENTTLDSLLDDEALSLPHRINGIAQDLNTLNAIMEGHGPATFDFDGTKLKVGDAKRIHDQLLEEKRNLEEQLALTDEKVIAWFLRKIDQHDTRERLRQKYNELALAFSDSDADVKAYSEVQQSLYPLYHPMQMDQIKNAVTKLQLVEVDLKARLEKLYKNQRSKERLNEAQKQSIEKYLEKDLVYFREPNYVQPSIDLLNECLYLFWFLSTEHVFSLKVDVLETQLIYTGLSNGIGSNKISIDQTQLSKQE